MRSWEEANTASPFKSESRTHRVAGQKLNFQRQPALRPSAFRSRDTALAPGWGENERGWLGQEKLSCHHRSAAGGGGRGDPGRLRSTKPGRVGLRCSEGCAPSPGTAARAPRCPFGRGQLLAAAARPPCAPAQATPGCASSAPGRPPEHPQPDRPSSSGARTNFLPPGPPGRAGWQAAPSPGFPGLRLQAPSPGTASFLPAPLQPRAPGAYRSLRLRSNKAGGPEATGPGAGSGSGGTRARRRHPWAGRAQRAGAVGTWRAEKGEESILLSARTPSTLVFARPRSPCCLCPSASGCPGGSWQGQRGRQRGRSGLAGEPLPYLCPE